MEIGMMRNMVKRSMIGMVRGYENMDDEEHEG